MIFKPSSLYKFFFTYICPRFYGGGAPSTPSQTTQTVNQNTIPEQLMPYVKNMLNRAEPLSESAYVPYSTNAADYVAPFSPLQKQAQAGAANLQTPSQFAPATQMAGIAGIGQLGTAQTAQGYGAQGADIGLSSALTSANQAGMQQAQAGAYGAQGVNLGMGSALGSAQQAGMQQAQAGMYGAQGANIGMGSARSSAQQAGRQQAQAGMYGAQGAGYGAQAAGFGQEAGMGFGGMGAGYGSQAAGMAGQGYGAGAQFAQQATDPNAVAAYMNPYVAQSLAPQLQLLNQQFGIERAKQQGAAAQAGAFGGSREALQGSLINQNQALAQQQAIAQGYNTAFNNAQQQQQFGANLGLQGMAAGQSALGMGIQGAQAGLQGANTALQGYQQGMAGAQAGLQGVGAQTAASQMQQQGAAQALQGAQTGLQGVGAQTAASQMGQQGVAQGLQGIGYGLQGVGAQTAASQMQQQGAAQGMQGAGYGLQGLNTAQQGYAGATQAAGQLGQLGTQQLAADTSVLGTQAQFGSQQQAQQQQAIDQAVLNYQNAQNYPYMQLGFMSNLLRGTPVGNTTQTTYMAQPGMASQLGGLAATGLGAYSALKAEGGSIKDRGYAKGGIVGYSSGGDVEESMRSKLEDLDVPHLQSVIQNKESPKMAGIAKEVLATRLAKGGIVAFANNKDKPKGSLVDDPSTIQSDALKIADTQSSGEYQAQEDKRKIEADIAKKAAPNLQTNALEAASGIPVAKPVVSTQTPVQPTVQVPPPVQTPQAMQTPFNAPVGAKAPVEATENPLKGILAAQEENVAASEKEANKSVEERVKEIADLKEKMLGKDTETAEYRKSLMEEKANSKDELRRQMGMRLMEFGANWASTPGAPLVAGMKALKESLPSVMQDTKENKKLMKDIDKSIYLLNHSERLDAEGKIDAAAKARQDASGIVMANKTKLTDFAMDKYKMEETARLQEKQIEATLEGHRISAGAAVEAAKIRGAGGKNGIAALGAKITSNDKQIIDVEKQLKSATIQKDLTKIEALNKTLSNLYKKRTYYEQMPAEIIDSLDDSEDGEDSDTFVPTEEQKALLNKYSKKG